MGKLELACRPKHVALAAYCSLIGGQAVAEGPRLLQAPAPEEMAQAYPKAALIARVEGKAVINCAISEDGTLRDCLVQSEEPENMGFGAAAASLAPKIRFAPSGGRISMPIRFVPPPAQPPLRELVFTKQYHGEWDWLGPVGPYFPERAERLGYGGEATIQCNVASDGKLIVVASCRKSLRTVISARPCSGWLRRAGLSPPRGWSMVCQLERRSLA